MTRSHVLAAIWYAAAILATQAGFYLMRRKPGPNVALRRLQAIFRPRTRRRFRLLAIATAATLVCTSATLALLHALGIAR